MLAFHGDIKIKEKYLERIEAHYKADEIIKGKYWEGGKGCAVGCTLHSSKLLLLLLLLLMLMLLLPPVKRPV